MFMHFFIHLSHAAFHRKAGGTSITMRVGERVNERSKICLFSCKWQVEITLFFHRGHPEGLVSIPAKSIPIMMFSVNPDIVHLSFNNRLLFR